MPDLFSLVLMYIILLFSVSVHECAHAWVADACGDSTARFMGRLTLNPLAHIDFIGTFLLPLLLILTGGGFVIGWAKPVPVNPRNLRRYPKDDTLVSIAGIGANFALAFLAAATMRASLMVFGPHLSWQVMVIMIKFISLNVILAMFNLIPLPPLDGSHILVNHLPYNLAMAYRKVERYSFIILILLLMSPLPRMLLRLPLPLFLSIAGLG